MNCPLLLVVAVTVAAAVMLLPFNCVKLPSLAVTVTDSLLIASPNTSVTVIVTVMLPSMDGL